MQTNIKNSQVEAYSIQEAGYHPFLIRAGWQLAQLNYTETQDIDHITRLDVHLQTDEVFVALSGKAVLIAARMKDGKPEFELALLAHNKIYNIPKNVWHNIAMEPGSQVLIAEKAHTHLADFEFFDLSPEKRIELKNKVKQLFLK
ncbi:MAG: hypothetical protein Sapg2KO_31800 [Saprospiraceae bacterium]